MLQDITDSECRHTHNRMQPGCTPVSARAEISGVHHKQCGVHATQRRTNWGGWDGDVASEQRHAGRQCAACGIGCEASASGLAQVGGQAARRG